MNFRRCIMVSERVMEAFVDFFHSFWTLKRIFTGILGLLAIPAFCWIFFSTSETAVTQLLLEEPPPDTYRECPDSQRISEKPLRFDTDTPLLVITPTYLRPEQMAELTKQAQTLSLVDQETHWIVVEDDSACNDRVGNLLKKYFAPSNPKRNKHITYSHLSVPMPSMFKERGRVRRFGLPRGVAQRRGALKWIRERTIPSEPGVIYFADDDNTYDVDVFSEVRKTQRISMLPVGLVQPSGISAPILNNHGRVIGFAGQARPFRKFPVDMAGFAFSISMLHERKPEMPYRATFEEEGFLLSMSISYRDIEPLAANCTRILAWHTMTAAPAGVIMKPPRDEGITNAYSLFKNMVVAGVAKMDADIGKDLPMCVGAECVQ